MFARFHKPKIWGYGIFVGIFAAACLWSAPAISATRKKFLVVIDPGHGGVDFGTFYVQDGKKIAEKDMTLALALQTARLLRAHGISATLTRTTDREIPLAARTALANRLHADLFLSIHMNSSQTAEGVETYILNNATNASSQRLAELENAVLGPHSPDQTDVDLILKDLRLDANLSSSKLLACAIQQNIIQNHLYRNRGVKQALFLVLLGADMPSALLEAGFLSNSHDRALVLSQKGRLRMSQAIVRAIEQYRAKGRTRFFLGRCKVD